MRKTHEQERAVAARAAKPEPTPMPVRHSDLKAEVKAVEVPAPPKAEPKAAAAKPAPRVEAKPEPKALRRGDVYVEVYNNSGISGLASSTASTIAGAGWQVVGSDNWYGTISASTVYYPGRLEDEAKLLAKDLGIKRMKPAISPMRLDRLTVILTADFS